MLPEPPDWQTRAACLDGDPDAFFPEKGECATEAKRICNGCQVQEQCLTYALDHHIKEGVWGGHSERERRALRQRLGLPDRARGPVKPCGTDAAYTRHIRHGERPCEPCREAHALAYQRGKRAS